MKFPGCLGKGQNEILAEPSPGWPGGSIGQGFGAWRGFLLATLGLALCFGWPLYRLAQFAFESELYSYILLMPFVSFYLVWLKRQEMPRHSRPDWGLAALFLAAGFAVLTAYWFVGRSALKLAIDDRLAFTTSSFLLLFLGVCSLFLGREALRTMAFPLAMLVFLVPLPVFLEEQVETISQYGSAIIAHAMFSLSGASFFREGLVFHLPGIPIQVAPECSGIHSSLVLLITSLLAGHLFLRSPGKRALLTLIVIPLGLLRNGFRIFTIGQLCVHIGPEMIDSPIHRRGGPLFFLLSLVPFLLLLVLLRKFDRASENIKPKQLEA